MACINYYRTNIISWLRRILFNELILYATIDLACVI